MLDLLIDSYVAVISWKVKEKLANFNSKINENPARMIPKVLVVAVHLHQRHFLYSDQPFVIKLKE